MRIRIFEFVRNKGHLEGLAAHQEQYTHWPEQGIIWYFDIIHMTHVSKFNFKGRYKFLVFETLQTILRAVLYITNNILFNQNKEVVGSYDTHL